MIETVQKLIARNAEQLLTPDEIERFEKPVEVHEYYNRVLGATAVRVVHRMGDDGSGGGFKILEVPAGMSHSEMLAANRRDAEALATLMTLKSGIISTSNFPEGIGEDFGGAKAVMYVPAGTLASREGLNAILTDYVLTQAGKDALGVGIDRHAPDMNTGEQDMDHMAKVLAELTQDPESIAAFSGKSLEKGGLDGREIATAQGLVYTLANHLETLGRDPRQTTAVVQGSGNVGYHFARLVQQQLGVKIIGMSDKDTAVVGDAQNPLRIDETIRFANRGIIGWDEESHASLSHPDDLLEVDADVFVFAAAPDAVTREKDNVHRLRAPIVLMGANNPMDLDAIDWARENGKSLVPDVLGNAGGFVASNMEYNQNRTGKKWSQAMVLTALKACMDGAYVRVLKEAGGNPNNLVDAAYRVGIKTQYAKDKTGLYTPQSA